MFLRVLCVIFACSFYCEARAQDTVYVTLKTCPEEPAPNDPTIVIGKKVTTDCASGAPVVFSVTDRLYGHTLVSRPLRKLPGSAPRVVEPMPEDVFLTHRPCRIAYVDENGQLEGEFIEWLLPKGKRCDGLPMGAYYRIYRPDNTVCVRPEGGCVRIDQLKGPGPERYREALHIAYANRR